MEKIKKFAPITIRVLISAVFLLSAFAKLYPTPLSEFEEKQLIRLLHFDNCFAPYFSRLMIALEIVPSPFTCAQSLVLFNNLFS